MNSKTISTYFDETTKESLIARMNLGEEEEANLKIKIATFVICELSTPTLSWFKEHFLSNIFINAKKADNKNKEILKAKNEFFNVVADYLITMESEVDYVSKILASFTEKQKRDFWTPIIFDAFLLAGIHLTSSLELSKNNKK